MFAWLKAVWIALHYTETGLYVSANAKGTVGGPSASYWLVPGTEFA